MQSQLYRVAYIIILTGCTYMDTTLQAADGGTQDLVEQKATKDGVSLAVSIGKKVHHKEINMSLTIKNEGEVPRALVTSIDLPSCKVSLVDKTNKRTPSFNILGDRFLSGKGVVVGSGVIVTLEKGGRKTWTINLADCYDNIDRGRYSLSVTMPIPIEKSSKAAEITVPPPEITVPPIDIEIVD